MSEHTLNSNNDASEQHFDTSDTVNVERTPVRGAPIRRYILKRKKENDHVSTIMYGKLYWAAKQDLEKAHLYSMNKKQKAYYTQLRRVKFCSEACEIFAIGLPFTDAWRRLEKLANILEVCDFLTKAKREHMSSIDFLTELKEYEEKLTKATDQNEKCEIYLSLIKAAETLARNEKYENCDCDAVSKILYERAIAECPDSPDIYDIIVKYARFSAKCLPQAQYCRVLENGLRQYPRRHSFWVMLMELAEDDWKTYDEITSIFKTALSKEMETFKDADCLWIRYLEYLRRLTSPRVEEQVRRLRDNFQAACDYIQKHWLEDAHDSEIPLFWARVEYNILLDPSRGKKILTDIMEKGNNKTKFKYWEAFVQLEHKNMKDEERRQKYKQALQSVVDHPESVARMWTDYERDYGTLETMKQCYELCEDFLNLPPNISINSSMEDKEDDEVVLIPLKQEPEACVQSVDDDDLQPSSVRSKEQTSKSQNIDVSKVVKRKLIKVPVPMKIRDIVEEANFEVAMKKNGINVNELRFAKDYEVTDELKKKLFGKVYKAKRRSSDRTPLGIPQHDFNI